MSDFADINSFRFDFVNSADALETDAMPPDNLRYIRRDAKREMINALKRKWCMDAIGRLPGREETFHLVSNARYDLWDMTPAIIQMAHATVDEWIGSSWTLNRRVINEMLALFDAGKIRSIRLLTGLYLRAREPSVFATAAEGLTSRGQRFRAAQNHAKFIGMMMSDGNAYVVSTSANLCENGNVENFCINNDPALFAFHRQWVEELLNAK